MWHREAKAGVAYGARGLLQMHVAGRVKTLLHPSCTIAQAGFLQRHPLLNIVLRRM